jgi:hypothetical protein
MTKPKVKFGFATVSSEGYIDHTAGLIVNLRTFYPETLIVVCTLDAVSYQAFSFWEDPHLITVSSETVWDPPFWRNISARMNRSERAFATKAALSAWCLETAVGSLLLLDSDLLFLDKVDDLIELLAKHPALLVASRHGVASWRKSQRFGLFSAGILGLTQKVINEVKLWKASCFDNCSAMPLSGLYYEQKYLDAFVNIPNIALIHDAGINISQTFLRRASVYRDDTNIWRTKDGTKIRIFHASRTSDKDLPLYKQKQLINIQGLKRIKAVHTKTAKAKNRGTELIMAKMLRQLAIGKYITRVLRAVPTLSQNFMVIYRTITIRQFTIFGRLIETFSRKNQLSKKLHNESQEHYEQSEID